MRRDWRDEREVADEEREEEVRGGSLRTRRFRRMCNTREII
jgi:hypothetical protein